MQLARAIVERITARTVFPMVTLGVSAALAAVLLDVLIYLRLIPGTTRSR